MSISHLTDNLILSSSPSQWKISQASPEPSHSSTVDVLRSLFLSLSPPFSPRRTRDIINYLQELEDDNRLAGRYASRSFDGDSEEQALKDAVLSRLVAAIYWEALDTLLSEAIAAEVEAQWWADLERSRLRVAYHLVQSASSSNIPVYILLTLLLAFPFRISNLFGDVLHILRSNNHPITFSTFKPSSIRGLLNRDTGRPDSISACIFPHLRTHPSFVPPPLGVYSLSYRLSSTSSNTVVSACQTLCHTFSLAARYILHYVTLPFQLTSQEIRVKCLELERIRDERAEALGELTNKHDDISRALRSDLDERAAFLQVIRL